MPRRDGAHSPLSLTAVATTTARLRCLQACAPSLPQAGNFGVILKYYFDLPKLAKLCKAPETYYNLWITPAAIGTKYCTCTMCAI